MAFDQGIRSVPFFVGVLTETKQESILTKSYEVRRRQRAFYQSIQYYIQVTFDLEFTSAHLIEWIWHHLDIKGYIIFKSHTNNTVDVFWQDPIHKRDWPSFTIKPKATEKRNVVLGHKFYLRKKERSHILESTYTVRVLVCIGTHSS